MEVGAFPSVWGGGRAKVTERIGKPSANPTTLEVPACARSTLITAGTTETPQDLSLQGRGGRGVVKGSQQENKGGFA